MGIYIQSITITWNKDYRGGQKAVIRNSIAESYELPLNAFARFNDDNIVIHQIRCEAHNNFNPIDRIYTVSGPVIRLKGAFVTIYEKNIQVDFRYSENDCGKPYRSKYDKTGTLKMLVESAFDLKKNEYGRLIFNGRYTDWDTGDWWYEKQIHNIIHTDMKNKNIFIENDVIKVYKQLASLK